MNPNSDNSNRKKPKNTLQYLILVFMIASVLVSFSDFIWRKYDKNHLFKNEIYNENTISWSPDGKELAVFSKENGNIRTFSLAEETFTDISISEGIFADRYVHSLHWIAENKIVVRVSSLDSPFKNEAYLADLYLVDLLSTEVRVLVETTYIFDDCWSPENNSILYATLDKYELTHYSEAKYPPHFISANRVVSLNIDSLALETKYKTTENVIRDISCNPSQGSFATLEDLGNSYQIKILDSLKQEEITITKWGPLGEGNISWSHDGSLIALYLGASRNKLVNRRTDYIKVYSSQGVQKLSTRIWGIRWIEWSPNDDKLLVQSNIIGMGNNIYTIEFKDRFLK